MIQLSNYVLFLSARLVSLFILWRYLSILLRLAFGGHDHLDRDGVHRLDRKLLIVLVKLWLGLHVSGHNNVLRVLPLTLVKADCTVAWRLQRSLRARSEEKRLSSPLTMQLLVLVELIQTRHGATSRVSGIRGLLIRRILGSLGRTKFAVDSTGGCLGLRGYSSDALI